MSIKLVLLKSNETVITDVKELVDENENLVSYIFEKPYLVRLVTPNVIFDENAEVETEHKVSFYPWIVLSNDTRMVVNKDWVVTILEPNDMVKDSYVDRMCGIEEKEVEVNETLIENFEVINE